MKLKAFALSASVVAAGLGLWTSPAHAQQMCTNDSDCTEGGTECGSYVCNFDQSTCVPADAGTGWCTPTNTPSNVNCKCASLGAICVGFTCQNDAGQLFITPPSTGTTSSSSSSKSTSSASSASSSSSSSTESGSSESTASSSKSGGCAVSAGSSSSSPWTVAGLALAGCVVAARRRRRL